MEKITINYLIDSGINRAIFWNCAYKDKAIRKEDLIIWAIKRGCDKEILSIYIDVFGFDFINNLIMDSREDFESKRFYSYLIEWLKELSPHK